MSDFRLKVFRSVAKNLSFTKASQELFVSQPAITKHIQELEAAYQTRLFDRQGSRISLTESGHLLLEHCERILEDYKRLEYEMHLLHNEYTGGLKLGASTTIAQYVLPPLLASFIGKFPQVSLSLLNGNSREIEAALQEHRIDLGFVEGVFRLPNIRYTTFLEDELVAVVRTGSKLAVGEEITPDELFHLPLVLSDFSLITSVGGSSDVKGYKLIPEAFPLMIKLPFSQFIRAFLFVLFLMVIFHALLSGVKRKIIPSWVYSNFPAWFACDENEILHCVLSIYCAYDNTG